MPATAQAALAELGRLAAWPIPESAWPPAAGTKFMPHVRQKPASDWRTVGCIGQ